MSDEVNQKQNRNQNFSPSGQTQSGQGSFSNEFDQNFNAGSQSNPQSVSQDNNTIPSDQSSSVRNALSGLKTGLQSNRLKHFFIDFFKNYQRLVYYSIGISLFIILLIFIFSSDQGNKDAFLGLDDERYMVRREKIMQEKIEKGISNALDLIVGQGHYAVSAIVTLDMVNESMEKLQFTPQLVTVNYVNEYDNRFRMGDEGQTEAQRVVNLPGFFDDVKQSSVSVNYALQTQQKDKATDQKQSMDDLLLPGFEPMSFSGEDLKEMTEPFILSPEVDTSNQGFTHIRSTKAKQQVFISRTKSSKVFPKYKINNIFVTVVLDEKVTDLLKISKKEITTLLKNMGNYQPNRGDKAIVSFIPFNESLWNFRQGVIVARKFVIGISIWIYLGVLILIVGGIYGNKALQGFLKKRAYQNDILAKEAETKKQSDILAKVKLEKEWFDQRKSLIDLAQDQPEALASLLSDWIDQEKQGESS